MGKKGIIMVFSVVVAVAGLFVNDVFAKQGVRKRGHHVVNQAANQSLQSDVPGRPSKNPPMELDALLGSDICMIDNFGVVYHIKISGGVISGTADSPYCSYNSWVTGSYTGTSFIMHVDDNGDGGDHDGGGDDGHDDNNNDCGSYTYTGVYNRTTKIASGTWVNDDGYTSGVFTANQCK